MSKPLSKVKKELKPHMWVISKDSAGGYIVTMGSPKKPGSRIKVRFSGDGAKDELKYWVKYDMPKQVNEDHMIDMTGLKLIPEFYTKWYVDNMMAEADELVTAAYSVGPNCKKVIDAFTDKKAMDGNKLTTDGKRLDGNWMGGTGIAEWKNGKIVFNDLGSKAAQTVAYISGTYL